ncbi:hypothetical protein C7M84_017420 [Penaeus vannamei]|uniref:SET domain-containing protein n=1 Tax=Penaeus vannamei TaxID=6689 RepID=A0A3R7QE85_PENVA|nr:hypothetical protein C7M84_017420 [Penaeus vannamei]
MSTHVDCMEIDRENIPDEYLCEACEPRMIDRFKARALQIRRRQEIKAHLARLSSSDSDDNMPMCNKSRASLSKVQERKVVKKKKVKQIKDMKNGRKGPLSLLKKSSSVSCNNNIVPGSEERDRRMLVKTRRRKSSSMSGGEGVSDDSCGGPVERLRAWVEGYEVAVTNHYSPELRARVQAARINGVSPDLRASTQGAVLGHRCKVMENPNPLLDVFDSKILVAATRLTVNTAITEFQGKYLLASQWNAQQPVMGQQYLPYVLQYHMPKEGLTVCVDARTYGNDARFTRRSCRPNAEIRHVVERGSLHLYLVATRDIEEAEEVTLALETANSTLDLVCCLSEEHDCNAPQSQKVEALSPVHNPPHKKNGLLNNKKTIKKQQLQLQLRTSKRTTSTESRSSDNLTTTTCQSTTPVTPVKQRRVSGCGKSPAKSPCVSASSSPEELSKDTVVSAPPTLAVTPETPKAMDKQQQQKMTREERKIAAYMKAFERMEKAAQRRQEMEKKKEEDKSKDPKDKDKKHCDGDEEDWEKTSSADEGNRNTPVAERSRRKGKKGRGKGSPQKRNHRLDTTASDLTGDESSCASVGLMSPLGGSVEGIALNFNSPPSGNSNVMGFRFPKTKKALMNEWLNETVDPVMPVGSPSGVTEVHSTGVPTCYMRSPATPLRRSTSVNQVVPGTVLNLDLPGGSAKKRWLRQAISEETESPQLNGLCPSPNSRPGGCMIVHPNRLPNWRDLQTPLKKRRLARESMSSEQSSTPPSTPVHSTSMEEDKMMEEMEAELAAGGVVKIKCEEESVAEDQSLQGEDHTGDAADTKDSLAIKEESTQETTVGKRESDMGCGSISVENVDERTPKEEGETDGSTGEKVEENKEKEGVDVKSEIGETDGNPEKAFRDAPKAEVGSVKPETQGRMIKSESGGDAAECGSSFQKTVKNELESLIATDCRIIVKKEKEVSEVSDDREKEGSDERTENVGNIEEKTPTQCSRPERKQSSKKPVSVKMEVLNDEQVKQEAVQEKPEICAGEVVGIREQSGSSSEREEQEKELVRANVHHCMVVKEGSTKTNAKAEQVLSRETCIKQEVKVEVDVQFNTSVKIEERDNIPQTQSQGSEETEVTECISKPAKETSPAPEEVLQREKSLGLVCSPSSSVLQGRRQSSQSDSDDLPVIERAQTPEGFHHKALEPKGPRTPEGPAPTSPEESSLMPDSPRTPESCSIGQDRSPEREASPERTSRARVRGPCTPPSTPPPQQDDSLDGESEREREQQDDCDKSIKSALHAKAAPVKRKLSILEYRKRKSVSSESETRGANGPHTSGSCAPSPVTLPSASITQEPLSSPSAASPAKTSCASAVDSSPDLSLSPIRPLSLSLPAVLDDKLTKDEGKREVESTTQRGDAAAEVSKDIIGSSKNNTGIVATSLPGITTSTVTAPTGTASQDVKWNAAPTLLERQRENLTARLRREFGLCISDDDEDKSGLRLGCVSVVGRPSPPLLPSPFDLLITPFATGQKAFRAPGWDR